MSFKFLLLIQVFSVTYLETTYASRASKRLDQTKIILYFPIPNNSIFLPPNFALTIVVKCSWQYADLPRAFQNKCSRKLWGQTKWIMGNWKIDNAQCYVFATKLFRRCLVKTEQSSGLGRRSWNGEVTGSNPPHYLYLDSFSVVPSSAHPPRFLNSQLVSLPPVGILNR